MIFRCASVARANWVRRRLKAFRVPVIQEGVRLYVILSPDRMHVVNVRGVKHEGSKMPNQTGVPTPPIAHAGRAFGLCAGLASDFCLARPPPWRLP